MKQTITFTDFRDAFRAYDRMDNFSYEGAKALFEYIEEMECECGTETELDVIALCCEFSEYEDAMDCVSACGYMCDTSAGKDYEERNDIATDYLNDNTMLITFDTGIIIQDF